MGDGYADGALTDAARRDSQWGDWRLGDLSDALQSASRVLGPSARVSWLAVYPPNIADRLPIVQIAAEDRDAFESMRNALAETGDLLVPLDGSPERNFEGVTDNLLVHVWVGG